MTSIQSLSREDYRRKKELEELRKAGAAPAEVDDQGNMINPHIPQYMSEAPWYISDGRPGLKHQKSNKMREQTKLDQFVITGRKIQRSTRFRVGACTNCGALSHNEKDCCERPRKHNAKFTGKDIAPDEIVYNQPVFDYASKRDNWKNYDIKNHNQTIEFSEKVNAARRKRKEDELDQMLKADVVERKELETKMRAEDNLADSGVVIQQMDDIKRQTVRNLRTREDTAKYLRNLDPDSAFYDPKTRSMRSNPNSKNKNLSNYLGDNFLRMSGEAKKFKEVEMFSLTNDGKKSNTQTGSIRISTDPTKAETVNKIVKEKEKMILSEKQKSLLERYGGGEHLRSTKSLRNNGRIRRNPSETVSGKKIHKS